MELPQSALALLWAKRLAPLVLGAFAGFGYYYFIGCTNGTCPISSNPWASTAYGALIGAVLTAGKSKKREPEDKKGQREG
jgi:hypothetical protein